VRLGRQLLATNLGLEPSRDDGELEFRWPARTSCSWPGASRAAATFH
jgi:hypothetical protein